jgi:hypothetical protein
VTIGWVGFEFELDGTGQFDFLEEIGSGQGQVRSGWVNLHVVFFQIFDRVDCD